VVEAAAERRLVPLPDPPAVEERGRLWAWRSGSNTVPLEQIGQSAKKRLWRQKVGKRALG
jgi:hypothetical protein